MDMVDAEIQAQVGGDVDPRHPSDSSERRRAEIIAVVRKISCVIDEIHGKTGRVSSELSKDDDVIRSGLNYIATIKETVDLLLRFLESPVGERATALLWKHIDGIRNLAEVGAGILISSLFVLVAQELLLDVKEDEFNLARRRIQDCISFVQSKLPEIERRINEAAELLQRVRQYDGGDAAAQGDNCGLEQILWTFKDTIRHAKLDIDDCNSKLEDADKQIEIAMVKIKAKIWLNGAWRGALITGAFSSCLFCKNRRWPMFIAFSTIAVLLSCTSLLMRVPRYRKLEMDFLEYKDTHDSLHEELRRLQRRLDSHEHAAYY